MAALDLELIAVKYYLLVHERLPLSVQADPLDPTESFRIRCQIPPRRAVDVEARAGIQDGLRDSRNS